MPSPGNAGNAENAGNGKRQTPNVVAHSFLPQLAPLFNVLITSHQSLFTFHLPFLPLPAVRFSDGNHCAENGIPGLLLQHHLISEHAPVPTDLLDSLSQFSLIVAKPVSGILGNI